MSLNMSELVQDNIPFENTYAQLPENFFSRLRPTPVKAPKLIQINHQLAKQLGLNPNILEQKYGDVFAGNRIPPNSEPLAMVYAGHQFGNWVPQLGDGRAILLGELLDRQGYRRDVQLKGAGPTPYSRMGDGRAVLGPVMREYIVSEAMAGLGIKTTRALAIALTGEMVRREKLEPGAVLTRVAASHIRVGTFQFFHAQKNKALIKTLADYVIDRHYPECRTAHQRYHALLEVVIKNTAELIASWMLIGFIHGVMNTDNTSIAGETIDYGPCAFMDKFNPTTVYSSIDLGGRYAYNQQAGIGLWNVTRFAETLIPLFGESRTKSIEHAESILEGYWNHFENRFHAGMCAKLGLIKTNQENVDLAFDLLNRMTEQGADFTLTFRHLSNLTYDKKSGYQETRSLFAKPSVFDEWLVTWHQKLAAEHRNESHRIDAMRAVNPAFIPRNHQVERAINEATESENFSPMEELLTVLTTPFEDHGELSKLGLPPKPNQIITQTFCGT